MHFTLTYTGELRANAKPQQKHEIREAFHLQMRTLWNQDPLIDHNSWHDGSNPKTTVNLNRPIGSFRFVPLISKDLFLVCKLSIFMLRPEPPGSLITQGGDIDNRLKTLFDALRIPHNTAELPKNTEPTTEQNPFFCLLEDDNLITEVSVKTDRLLTPTDNNNEVHLDIQVETRATSMITPKNGSNRNEITGGFALT
jgi:hypothetical protein